MANPNTQITGLTGAESEYQHAWSGPNSGLSAEMKTFYDMNLIDEAQAALVHDQFGQKRPIPKNGGRTIEFRKFDSLPKALNAITEGVTPDGNSLNVQTIEAAVKQYGDYIVQSDLLELTAIDNTILEATKILGRQAGLTLDTITRNIITAGTNVTYATKVVDGVETKITSRSDLDTDCSLKVKDIQYAVAKLRGQNAPTINGDYVAIIHPYVAYDLMTSKDFVEAHKYAEPSNIYEGEIGKIGGVRFVQTSEARIIKPGAHAIFCTLILGANAYGTTEITGGGLQTIVKQLGYGDDPLNQRSSVGWKATKTAERLLENHMVRIESCSPDFDTVAAN